MRLVHLVLEYVFVLTSERRGKRYGVRSNVGEEENVYRLSRTDLPVKRFIVNGLFRYVQKRNLAFSYFYPIPIIPIIRVFKCFQSFLLWTDGCLILRAHCWQQGCDVLSEDRGARRTSRPLSALRVLCLYYLLPVLIVPIPKIVIIYYPCLLYPYQR